MVLNMCRTILKRVELLNLVIAYSNLYDTFSTDFLMSLIFMLIHKVF